MATPTQDAIDTFISITGASDSIALQKLQEHRGDLNQAVNAYFSEADPNIVNEEAPVNVDAMDIDDVIPSAPFAGLDSSFGRSVLENDPFMPRPFVSHPREVRQIPIEVKDSSGPSSDAPTIEDVTEIADVQGEGTRSRGRVIIDEESDDEDDVNDVPYAPIRGRGTNNVQDYNDIEEEMIRAAIEASKREAEGVSNPLPEARPSHMEGDDDIAKAVTMSLKSAEEEVLRNQGFTASTSQIGTSELVPAQGIQGTQGVNGSLAAPSSPVEDDSDDVEEQPLVRHRPRRAASGSMAPPNPDRSRSRSPEGDDNPADAGTGFPSEWGGLSSEEHDEAVMLEAAMFGGVPETGYNHHIPFLPPQPRVAARPPSPTLTAQRLIREQQDDEYLASLQADRDKELQSRVDEENARKAFVEEEKRKEEEAQRKLEEEQELERLLGAKEASLPKEPQASEENAITLQVRMPDGTRLGRRFLKSHKLQSLFDFIDIARVVKPNSYRLVSPYPRRTFADGESNLTLNDLGLNTKQEALFLELI